MEREFDVVLFGATGFVGRLIAAELARSAPDPTRIALAGRHADRTAAVAREVGLDPASIIVADAFDDAAVAAMARRTRVVLSVVGPYVKYGRPTVRACAEAGTHYVDLDGEVLFAREVADDLDETAKATGATLVHACGFDSVPSDLGVLLAADAARDAGVGELTTTTLHVRELVGGMSGGTIDALRTQIDATRRGERRPGWSSSDPYALSPDRAAEPEPPRRGRDQVWLESSADTREFAAPFFMARFNEQIVRRSNALLGWRYGRGLRYREVRDTGSGPLGVAAGIGTALALPGLVLALATPGLRQVTDRILPSPGDGPSPEKRAEGRFRMEVHAVTSGGKRVVAVVADERDPGYDGTAVLVSEAALALAAGEGLATGASTPAVALGRPYADRLRERGFELHARVR